MLQRLYRSAYSNQNTEAMAKTIDKDKWQELRQALQEVMQETGLTAADVSREIGKAYMQVYQWLVIGKRTPRADVTLALLKWGTQNAKSEKTQKKIKSIYA